MAVRKIRALLNSAEFPWLGSFAGRSITDAADLNSRMPVDWSGTSASREVGVPQLLYCENVLPTTKGIKSVGFAQLNEKTIGGLSITNWPGAGATGVEVVGAILAIPLATADSSPAIFLHDEQYGAWIYDPRTNTWPGGGHSPSIGSGVASTKTHKENFIVTVAGLTYLLLWDGATATFGYYHTGSGWITVALSAPIAISSIYGFGAAANRLLFFTKDTVYWDSALTRGDFNSIDTGAGNQIPIGLKGTIQRIIQSNGGCYIYTTENVIWVGYTNQLNTPFTFKEVAGMPGITKAVHAVGGTEEREQYVWTRAGFFQISNGNAETVFPGLTAALASGLVEYWDATAARVKLVEVGGPLEVKLSLIFSRFLVVSYRHDSSMLSATAEVNKEYHGAFICDLSTRRWGRVTVNHAAVIEFPYPTTFATGHSEDYVSGTPYTAIVKSPQPLADFGEASLSDFSSSTVSITPAALRGFCFVGQNGIFTIMNLTDIQQDSSGVAVFGHFQLDHNNQVTTQLLELQGNLNADSVKVTYLASELGSDRSSSLQAPVIDSSPTMLRLGGRITGENIDIAIEGGFVLTDMMLGLSRHGSR